MEVDTLLCKISALVSLLSSLENEVCLNGVIVCHCMPLNTWTYMPEGPMFRRKAPCFVFGLFL